MYKRQEYRLRLRADNADQRLTPKGVSVGLVGRSRQAAYDAKSQALDVSRETLSRLGGTPQDLAKLGFAVNADGQRRSAMELLAYPKVTWERVAAAWPELTATSQVIADQLTIEARYAGYLARQDADIRAYRRDEQLSLPSSLNIDSIGSLSTEIREIIKRFKPRTLGQAARLPGMTPAATVALMRYIKTRDAA